MKKGRFVGIDLGTTNSAVAVIEPGGGCNLIFNSENERLTPSVVAFRKGEFYIGSPALNVFKLEPQDTIISIKRLMGRSIKDPQVQEMKRRYLYEIVEPSDGTKDSVRVKLGGKEYSPIDISAMILGKLKKDAERVLGAEVTHAVITVPAYFSDKQREATMEAGRRAGLKVMKLLDEPTAAAIAYGIKVGVEESKWVLVYDLGGGTFDVSILVMSAGGSSVVHLEGDMWLGGDDFDQVIIDYVVERVKEEYGIDPTHNHRFMAHLRVEARKAKEILSSQRTAEIIIPAQLRDELGNAIDVEEEINREWFEKKIEPLVERTMRLTRKALDTQGLTPDDIDHVILAGNATIIPKVQEAVEGLFGKEKVKRIVHPKEAVAIGAAIVAGMFEGIECVNCGHINDLEANRCAKCGKDLGPEKEEQMKICPHCGAENKKDAEICKKCGKSLLGVRGIAPFHYGIQTVGDKFNIFIRKGDPYPTPEESRKVQTFRTWYPNQRRIAIPVYGGMNEECASKNDKQGEAFCILPPNLPEDTPVRIKLWLNKDGYFEVEAYLEDGTDLKPWIMRGDKDQLVMEKFMEAEKQIAEKEGMFSPDQKSKLEQLREKVFEKMRKRDFDGALKEVEELKKSSEEPIEIDIEEIAKGLIAFTLFIIDRYGWMIGSYSIKTLQNAVTELEYALNKGDHNLIQTKSNKLKKELDEVLNSNELLIFFVGIMWVINTQVASVSPVEAVNLLEELEDIEIAVKNNQPHAIKMIENFDKKLKEILSKIKIECYKCRYLNYLNVRYCEKCGADLWLPK